MEKKDVESISLSEATSRTKPDRMPRYRTSGRSVYPDRFGDFKPKGDELLAKKTPPTTSRDRMRGKANLKDVKPDSYFRRDESGNIHVWNSPVTKLAELLVLPPASPLNRL